MKIKNLILFTFLTFIYSCNGQEQVKRKPVTTKYRTYGGELSRPSQSEIRLDSSLVINQFNERNFEILKRYISGNPRWEIRKEKKYKTVNGKHVQYEVVYAIRKEERNGNYETTLNGYYSNFNGSSDIYQTRVIVSFGNYYGHGRDTSYVTYANPKKRNIKTIIEAEHSGTPGNSSYLILKGNSINIEVYEQSKKLEREFTIQALKELNFELSMVLENANEINTTGISPLKEFYPLQPDSNYFDIEDGMQPGIYVVKAGLSIKEKGIVYVKAFNSKTNERLSADRMTPRTTRELGWSENGKSIFPYESDLTVYEGDWSNKYKARFEIWFQPENGDEIKLTEKDRMINGWQR
ncbi:hypothetical protein [Winogradskyella flava]|uniref:Uncharacterized protein n=1 Tax=Winogradskyella flava TaxID=1884876 RepID=A0A842IUM6_9FLAO|nr:hypothetical protein [Winogradskyella flava]MBC2845604.1 hypothetical protein [Winogradskyella flava]